MLSSVKALSGVFTQWRLQTALALLAAFRSENQRVVALVGRKSSSIWGMNKEDLIEEARKELGLQRAAAEKETVTTLREKIRRSKAQRKAEMDPLSNLPKGLDRMTAAQLKEECVTRSISTDPLPDQRGSTMTRPQMILKIREDVELRSAISSPEESRPARATSQRRRPSTAPHRSTTEMAVDEGSM